MLKRWMFAVVLVFLPVVTLAQQGPCLAQYGGANQLEPSKICQSPAGPTWTLEGSILLRNGRFYGDGATFNSMVVVGDPWDGHGILATSGGTVVRGRFMFKSDDDLSYSQPVVAAESCSGNGALDSSGKAAVVLERSCLKWVNTDPADGGGYEVNLTPKGPDALYYLDSEKTPTQFVVRSLNGRPIPFHYSIDGVRRGFEPRRLSAEPMPDEAASRREPIEPKQK